MTTRRVYGMTPEEVQLWGAGLNPEWFLKLRPKSWDAYPRTRSTDTSRAFGSVLARIERHARSAAR